MPPDATASMPVFCIGDQSVDVPIRPVWVMGIVNVTPDSFSDGGEFFDCDRAVARALQQVEQGAAIIDIGAESTRPGSIGVAPKEQIRRAIPVIERLRSENGTIPISIDTTSADVARLAIRAGANVVNDTSALRDDLNMVDVVAGSGASVILMHRRGTPRDMQAGGGPHYGDVVGEIILFHVEQVEFAVRNGVPRQRIAIDPGIGFGKQGPDNWKIIRSLSRFTELGLPVVVGVSRKRFIGDVLDIAQPRDRRIGSVACATLAAAAGASILRVHDVLETLQAMKIIHAVSTA